MQHYELLILLPGKLSETELPTATERVRNLCREGGLTITREEPLGKKRLAYAIAGDEYAYAHAMECDAEPANVKTLTPRLALSTDVLRHIVRAKPIKSAAVQERALRLRERVAQRRAARIAATPTTTSTATPAVPAAPVDVAALDKKLEELLTTPEKV